MSDEYETITRRKARHHSELTDNRVPGKIYNIYEGQKASLLGVSPSWLQKDRLQEKPEIDFARYGRSVRYSAD
jgi:hypothetical protein